MLSADAGSDARHDASSGGGGGSAGAEAGTDAALDGTTDAADANLPTGPLAICSRLTEAARERALADFTAPYIGGLRADCRVTLLTQGTFERQLAALANQLRTFNYSFWGCDSRPLGGFHIVYEAPALTALDVATLIEIYVNQARRLLALSPSEESTMRSELQRLGAAAQTSSAPSYTYSQCDAGTPDAGDAGSPEDAGDGASSDAAPDVSDELDAGGDT